MATALSNTRAHSAGMLFSGEPAGHGTGVHRLVYDGSGVSSQRVFYVPTSDLAEWFDPDMAEHCLEFYGQLVEKREARFSEIVSIVTLPGTILPMDESLLHGEVHVQLTRHAGRTPLHIDYQVPLRKLEGHSLAMVATVANAEDAEVEHFVADLGPAPIDRPVLGFQAGCLRTQEHFERLFERIDRPVAIFTDENPNRFARRF